jgi:hypothetical protein
MLKAINIFLVVLVVYFFFFFFFFFTGFLTYQYEQPIPIPSYLIAIAAGKLEKASLGPRSNVWTEKELLQASVHEFGEETEKYIQAGFQFFVFCCYFICLAETNVQKQLKN